MHLIARLVDLASKAVLILAGIALVLMMLHVVADIGGKYLFAQPIAGTTRIVSWYYMVAVAFLPAAYVQLQREHLVVELFTMALSERQRAVIEGVMGLGIILYTGLLTKLVYGSAVKSTLRGEYTDESFFDLPVWPARWMLPLAFGLLTLVFAIQTLDDWWFALRGKRLLPRTRAKSAATVPDV